VLCGNVIRQMSYSDALFARIICFCVGFFLPEHPLCAANQYWFVRFRRRPSVRHISGLNRSAPEREQDLCNARRPGRGIRSNGFGQSHKRAKPQNQATMTCLTCGLTIHFVTCSHLRASREIAFWSAFCPQVRVLPVARTGTCAH
jgi:hypothetical protein